MRKLIKFLVLSSCLALSALLVTGASAQTVFCHTLNLNTEDCELITTATENIQSKGAFAFTYSSENISDTGFFNSNDHIENATGVLVYDEEGNITSARIDIPSISSVSSFSDSTNALSFVVIDNIIYIGVGETLDDVTWEQMPEDFLANSSFSINSLILLGNTEASASLSALDVSWTREDSNGLSVFSTSVTDIDPFAALYEGEDATFLGDTTMTGNMTASVEIAVDTTNNLLAYFTNTSHMTYNIGNVDVGGIIDEATTEELPEVDGDMFNDLIGSFLSEEQLNASNSTLNLSFDNVDTSIIVAPEVFEPVSDELLESIAYTYISDPISFITDYYTEYSFINSFTFDFGDFDFGDYDLSSWTYFSGMCEEGQRDHIAQGTISVGDVVTGNLTSSSADVWTFEATAGDLVTIELNSNVFDAYLELFTAADAGLVSDDDSGGNLNARITEYPIEETGTYQIVACSYNYEATGEYTLSLGK